MKADLKNRVLIVGGGPAGMMAAIAAGNSTDNVLLIEQNSSCGKKLLVSGNGRCNFTNARDIRSFPEHFAHGGTFLRDAFNTFSNRDLIDFFKNRGLSSHCEEDQKVFPVSDNAGDVLNVLLKELKKKKVKILYNTALEKILLSENAVEGIRLSKKEIIPGRTLILATGGISYPHTGSDGCGLRIAKTLPHTVTPLLAGLTSIQSAQEYIRHLEGISLRGVVLTLHIAKKKLKSQKGDIMFTRNGLSGPLAMSYSSKIALAVYEHRNIRISIDLFPDMTNEMLHQTLKDHWQAHSRKNLTNSLSAFVPERFAHTLLNIHRIDTGKTVSYMTKRERTIITGFLKNLTLDITGCGPVEKAMVTRGGISLKEVDPRSMASRIIKGLYFAGEMLDIDGDTGGFNLQAAFSTGYLAGIHAAGEKRK
ncbi:MAG: NAD(P)/FAD-dependent oxidoreductase [Candidatus Omnitrophica bacterium]|nr:NAD(P)/FAD-dependent oxidoreductase [Candidatus Omnitrophota bacterium]